MGVAPDTCVEMNGKSLTSVLDGLWTRSRLRDGSWEVLQREANGIIGAGSLDPVACRGQYSVDLKIRRGVSESMNEGVDA
jgi:hypothetical protein